MKLKEIEQHNKKIINAITKCGNTIIELKMKESKLKREIKEPCKFCSRNFVKEN